jgi:hypothetical protein
MMLRAAAGMNDGIFMVQRLPFALTQKWTIKKYLQK